MFARVIKSKGKEYLNIIDSYRDKNGQPKQKVLANLGRVDELKINSIENLAKKLLEIVESKKSIKDSETPVIEELDRLNYGFIAYKKIWNRFKFDEILDEIIKDSNIKYKDEFKNIVFSLVIDRLLNPKSKLALFNNKDDYFYINDKLQLERIYRVLDILSENKELIEKSLFMQNKNLFNISTDIVFYDLTTFYFESKNEDELRKFGYSKDAKFNEVQIVMGLLIDREGIPIGYEIFSGDTFEGNTIVNILDKLKDKFAIENVVIVADRGLNSKLNLKMIKDKGYNYIVSSKLKSLSNETKDKIINGVTSKVKKLKFSVNAKRLNLRDYEYHLKEFSKNAYIKISQGEDGVYKYKELDYINRVIYKEDGKNKRENLKEKIICTYSDKRAKKDRYDRERALNKANDLIVSDKKSDFNSTKGFRRFIEKIYLEEKESSEDKCKDYVMGLKWEKIKSESIYDGFYAIQSSREDLTALEVIENYHNLYKIEDSFRVLKSTFNTRPIFHYKESRIEGHFIMSFISFMLERDLEIRLKKSKSFKSETITPERIRESLNSLEVSKVKIDNKIFYMKANHTNGVDKLKLGKKIHSFLKIKQLKSLNSYEEIMKIFI